MCGIAGILRPDGLFDAPEPARGAESAVRRMVDSQRHRGPDQDGLLRLPGAVLGHTRLSIFDLSEAGRQPLCNETGDVWVSYNGEVYNFGPLRVELIARGHRFHCGSDTEVLVHGYEEWGLLGMLERLEGMFAFCLHDVRRRLSYLVRDRLGIKPLYYSWDGHQLAFASEVKALRRGGATAFDRDREALAGFLAFGSIPAPLTQYKQVRCLEPGHYLVLSSRGMEDNVYWVPPEEGARPSAAISLPELLRDSVKQHLAADVDTGVFLSGGIDSAAIVSLARMAGVEKLTTLTVAFEESEFNEESPARMLAAHYSTDHCQLVVRKDDFLAELPRVFEAMDQPSIDGVNSYFVSWMARQAGVKVALSGLGADEVFWGYHYYRWLTRYRSMFDLLMRGPASSQWLVERAFRIAGSISGQDRWSRFLAAPGNFAGALYGFLRGFLSPPWIQRTLSLDSRSLRETMERQWSHARNGAASTPARTFNRIELSRYLHDTLLRDTDVFSMAHSIEVRVPFLDRRIVEWAMLEPDERKVTTRINKPLLVDSVPPMPIELDAAKKRGFVFPIREWMRSEPERFLPYVERIDYLDTRAVRDLWNGFLAGRTHWSRAWGLVALGARF